MSVSRTASNLRPILVIALSVATTTVRSAQAQGPASGGSRLAVSPSSSGVSTAWYVAATGSNANDCLTPGSPCATINAAVAKAASQVAYGGTTDGAVIYQNLCGACHTNGVGKAPTLDHAHWDARIAQGNETLYKHAIEGFTGPDGGIMPPRGGNPALTDEQVKATVDWMLANLK